MKIFIEGIGLLGPGLAGWNASQAMLINTDAYVHSPTVLPAPEMLPPAERRRVGAPIKVALAVGKEAFAHADRDMSLAATVFSSSGGDGENVHAICETLATSEREVSPTRFHNSVHNAAAGYWGIAAKSHEASTSLCCHDASFAAGLLETASQIQSEPTPVVLIAYDQPYPEPLASVRPISDNFGIAMILTSQPTARSIAALEVNYVAEHMQCTTMQNQTLESLRKGVPAARCLPLLEVLAKKKPSTVVLDYLAGSLTVSAEFSQ